MTPPDPPEWLSGDGARAAFFNGYTRCSAVCEWEPIFSRLLAVLAASASIYVQLMLEGLRKDAADQRLVTRELMVEFLLIDRAAVNAGTLRADGFDSDIAALCDIPPVQ